MIDDPFSRILTDLIGRLSGPMKFRLVLQPVMAAFFAIRSGLEDAKEGRPPYFRTLFTQPALRRDLLKDGFRWVGKVYILAIVLDAVYQFIVFKTFYPGEALIVAFILAIIPYILIRGSVSRAAKRLAKKTEMPAGGE